MDVKKATKRAKVWMGYAAFLICCFAAGYLIAWSGHTGGASITTGKIFSTAKVLVFFCLCAYLHILLHEAGHLLAGLTTGYRFVSFRVASFTLVRTGKGFAMRRFSIPGTAGQCLMMPGDCAGEPPYILYNLGGVLMNLLLSLAACFLPGVFFRIFSAAGLILGLFNGIPLQISGIPNDGYNLYVMMKNPAARRAFAAQLSINGLMSEGKRPRDLSEELFALEPAARDLFSVTLRQLRYARALDAGNLSRAREELDAMQRQRDALPAYYQLELDCERAYLMMLFEESCETVDLVYGRGARAFAQKAQFMLSHLRVEIAYALQCEGDVTRARELYRRAEKCAALYPVAGEAVFEMDMMRAWMRRVE